MNNKENPIKNEDVMNIHNPQTPLQIDVGAKEEINKKNKGDFNGWVVAILWAFLISSFIHLIVQFSQNLSLDMVDLAIYQLVGGLINCLSFLIILYKKNIWGVWLFFAMMILQIPLNVVRDGYIDESVIDSALIRVALLSIILLIRKDGISAWSILLASNKTESFVAPIETFRDND